MRESTFIFRNKERWERLEDIHAASSDELTHDFISLLNDLSYAKTHYPYSKLTAYLNKLASHIYKTLYLDQDTKKNPLVNFWKHELPTLIGKHRKILYLATGLFLTFIALGLIFSFTDNSFVNSILGDEYLTMTEQNIADGKPFGVYNDKSKLDMFVAIFSNNFMVGLIIFTSGIFLGLGAIYITFQNGILIGAFFSIFIKHNLGFDAFLVIMLHGTIELMGLILECLAGILLGLSFAFPGALSRRQAFINGLNTSAKIFIGTVPFTFLAALIESFVTYLGERGFTALPIGISIALALVLVVSWTLVIWYFFIYAKRKAEATTVSNIYRQMYA